MVMGLLSKRGRGGRVTGYRELLSLSPCWPRQVGSGGHCCVGPVRARRRAAGVRWCVSVLGGGGFCALYLFTSLRNGNRAIRPAAGLFFPERWLLGSGRRPCGAFFFLPVSLFGARGVLLDERCERGAVFHEQTVGF